MYNKNLFVNTISFFICVIFICTSIVDYSIAKNASNLFSIPESIGKIIETYQGKPSKPHIILIQDLHCHGKVQQNIASIIEVTKNHYKERLQVVGVEGSEGIIDTSIVRDIPSQEFRSSLSNKLVSKAYINGAELYDIINPRQVILFGVENRDLYNKNLRELKDNFIDNKKLEKELKDINKKIIFLKDKFYNKKLKKIEKLYNNYRDGKIGLYEFLTSSYKVVNLNKSLLKEKIEYKNIDLFIKQEKLRRSLDQKRLHSEMFLFTNKIAEHLDEKEKEELNKKKNDKKVFYAYVLSIVDKKNIKNLKEVFPSLYMYQQMKKYSNRVNELKLLEENKEYMEGLKLKCAQREIEEQIVRVARYVELLFEYINNSVSSKGSEDIEKNTEEMFALLKILGIKVEKKIIKKNIGDIRQFYNSARKRNEVMVGNLLGQIYKRRVEGVPVSTLLIGGFHADGIMEVLRNRGLGYTVVVPTVEKDENYSKELYFKRIKESEGIPEKS